MPKKNSENLTKADFEFIRENAAKMPIQEIAKHLDKSSRVVISAIEKHRFRDLNLFSEVDKQRVVETLRMKPFFKLLRKQLSQDELEIFVTEWVNITLQFQEDLLPTEESELRDLITLSIMKNRILEENRQLMDKRMVLEEHLKQQQSLGPAGSKEFIVQCRSDINEVHSIIDRNIKNFKELMQREEAARTNLNASRGQRIKKIDDARQNFTNWLRLISEYESRTKVGREMDIVRQSMEKREKQFGEFTSYADGKIDMPVLNELTADGKEFEEEDD